MTTFEFKLEGELGLRDCNAVRDQLAEALAQAPSVSVQTHAVQDIDLSILQLLVAAARSAAGLDGDVAVNARAGGPIDLSARRAGLADRDGRSTIPALHFHLS